MLRIFFFTVTDCCSFQSPVGLVYEEMRELFQDVCHIVNCGFLGWILNLVESLLPLLLLSMDNVTTHSAPSDLPE